MSELGLDGNTLRRSRAAGSGVLHLVSTWASANRGSAGAGGHEDEVQRDHASKPAGKRKACASLVFVP
jgi:hypothetical protein